MYKIIILLLETYFILFFHIARLVGGTKLDMSSLVDFCKWLIANSGR